MIKLDNALLAELGLADLPVSHRRAILQILYEELEYRVGMHLASAMSSLQLSQFRRFIEASDRDAALVFLNREFANYREVVAAEFDGLRAEIAAHLQDIRALCGIYSEIQIELPPTKDPWRRPRESADS